MVTQPLIVGSWAGSKPVVSARSARAYSSAPTIPHAEQQWNSFLAAEIHRGRQLQTCIAAIASSTGIGYMALDVRTCADFASELVIP